MKKAWVLSRLYINSLYGISGFFSDIKDNKKAVFKKIGFILLIGFGLSGTLGMFVALNIKMYDMLKDINQQGIIITLTVIVASLMTLIFGMIGIINTYFVEKEGDIILSMPIKPWQILVAKFASNYVYEAVLSIIIMSTGFVVYGVKSGSGPLFYIICLIIAGLVPLIPLTIGYFLVIPLMRAGSILRKKNFTMIMTSVIAIIFAIGIQYLSQSMVRISNNPAEYLAMLTSPNGLVGIARSIYYPSVWATYAITSYGALSGFVNLIVFAGISLMVVAILITAMSGVYATSITGSQEVTKTKKFTESQLKENLKAKGVFGALLGREIKLMNREPVFLLNGPLVILLMPLILGVALYMQRGELSKAFSSLASMNNSDFYSTLAMAGVAVFLGVSVNITSTCISREGKAFEVLKAMPINPKKYILAKLVHGIIFGVFASILISAIGQIVLNIGLMNALMALVISVLVMLPILIFGIIIEFAWPKLIWDNPQKAMKQNLNGVIVILGSMAMIALMGFIIFKFFSEPMYVYAALIILPLLLSVIMFNLLMSYGSKRFYDIEV